MSDYHHTAQKIYVILMLKTLLKSELRGGEGETKGLDISYDELKVS